MGQAIALNIPRHNHVECETQPVCNFIITRTYTGTEDAGGGLGDGPMKSLAD